MSIRQVVAGSTPADPSVEGAAAPTIDGRGDPGSSGAMAVQILQRLGHFVILAELGRGGMGTVFAAYDEHLDRKAAIKLLNVGTRTSQGQRRRMRREAQAMARISHPNVVSVYEVAEVSDQVYIAMEFVDGTTLAAWQRESGRTWQQILGMYLQAGQGLMAAHAMMLVHRDFKPDNVLVGRDGRARPGVAEPCAAAHRVVPGGAHSSAGTLRAGGAGGGCGTGRCLLFAHDVSAGGPAGNRRRSVDGTRAARCALYYSGVRGHSVLDALGMEHRRRPDPPDTGHARPGPHQR